jgi:Pentapeptide repeats (9 copies)
MQADRPKQRRPVGDQEPARRRDADEARLWHIGTVLAVSFTVAVLGLAGLVWLAWVLLGTAGFRRHGAPALHDTVGVLQLVFATVAGAGALVALVVAYRRQKIAEADSAHDRTRVFNERFTAIAAQLGDDKPAVRLAGVHAMAGLADDWKSNRQTCIDVLCAYLHLPYEPDPGEEAPAPERLAFRASREVRHTVIRVITAHLREDAAVSWQDLNFYFTGVIFDGGDFRGAEFSSVTAVLDGAKFSGGTVSFNGAKFSGGTVPFRDAEFSGGTVSFRDSKFERGTVSFVGAVFFGGEVDFSEAGDWSHPPTFDWEGVPPAGVRLPAAVGRESQ